MHADLNHKTNQQESESEEPNDSRSEATIIKQNVIIDSFSTLPPPQTPRHLR